MVAHKSGNVGYLGNGFNFNKNYNQKAIKMSKNTFLKKATVSVSFSRWFAFVLTFAFILALSLSLCACSQTSQSASSESQSASSESTQESSQVEQVKVMALNGPTGIGMASLSKNDAYSVSFVGSTDEVVSAFASGSVDIAAVPTNLASALWNKTEGKVQMLVVDTLGSLYLLENGESISSLADLAGRKVYATGQGANPQYIFEYLLKQAGLEPGVDVEIEYLSEHSELAALVATGEAELALLPEPFVSVAQSKGEGVRIALDMGAEFEEATGNSLAMGCVIVRPEFAEQNPGLVEAFLSDLNSSISQSTSDVEETAQLCADLGVLPSAEIASAAIPKCSLVCITGTAAQNLCSNYLEVLYQSNPKSVGGALPTEGFYF
jgi:NitT/TauT family transport system substrate-binding protein